MIQIIFPWALIRYTFIKTGMNWMHRNSIGLLIFYGLSVFCYDLLI